MKSYKFDYTFCPETAEYFDDSLRDEILEVSYDVVAGHVYLTGVKIRTHEAHNYYIELLPVLLAFKGTKELERAAAHDYEGRKVEQMYNNYPHLAKPLTTEEKVELLKLK